MLQKLDTEHLNRLAVAEALSKLKPTEFDIRDASRCICAHTLRRDESFAPKFVSSI